MPLIQSGNSYRNDVAGRNPSWGNNTGDKKDWSEGHRRNFENESAQGKAAQVRNDARDAQKKSEGEYIKGLQDQGSQNIAASQGVAAKINAGESKLQADSKVLQGQAAEQANNANKVYTDLSTRMSSQQDDADKQAADAMSLAEYQDPNNRVATATRGLYDQQAQNEGKQGLADFGVLSSLGAQSMGSAMGGMGPMTVGQQMSMMGQSQNQAAGAFQNTQRRMQNLRDQGLQMGFERTDKAYGAGQDAKKRQADLVNQHGNLIQQGAQVGTGLRNEQGANAQAIAQSVGRGALADQDAADRKYNVTTGTAAQVRGIEQGIRDQDIGDAQSDAGVTQNAIDSYTGKQDSKNAARDAQNAAMLGAGIGAAGQVAGAYMGRPPTPPDPRKPV